MKLPAITQALVVCRKELKDWSRDRRSIITVLFSSLFAPAIIGFDVHHPRQPSSARSRTSRSRSSAAQHAPALMDWLRQQAGVTIADGPGGSGRGRAHRASEGRRRRHRRRLREGLQRRRGRRRCASSPTARSQQTRPKVQRVRGLFQRYSNQIGSLRLIARGVSPSVATALQIEDVEVSSAQQRAATLLGVHPAVRHDRRVHRRPCRSPPTPRPASASAARSKRCWSNPAPRGAIAAGKWIGRHPHRDDQRDRQRGLLFALFQYIPLQDLGIRFRLGQNELLGTLVIVLPLCPLIVGIADVRRDVRQVVQGSAELPELPDDGADGAGHDGDDEHDDDEGVRGCITCRGSARRRCSPTCSATSRSARWFRRGGRDEHRRSRSSPCERPRDCCSAREVSSEDSYFDVDDDVRRGPAALIAAAAVA